RHFLAVRMGFFPPNRLDQLTGRGEEYRDFVRETRKIIACGTTFARGSAKPDTTHFGATDLPFAFRIRPVMKASVRFRRGHAWYSGAISRTTFLAWLETPEGQAAVDDAASRIRFVFLAKYRAARALWRRLVAAARDPHVVVTIQSEMDAYLGRVHELAYSGGLPRLRVDLHRIVVVPRVLINGAAYGAIARRLRSERAFASLEGGDAIRDFFIRTLVGDLDAAIAATMPSPKRPLEVGRDWISIGLDSAFVWRLPLLNEPPWDGHHYVLERTRNPITRAVRENAATAVEQIKASLEMLSRLE